MAATATSDTNQRQNGKATHRQAIRSFPVLSDRSILTTLANVLYSSYEINLCYHECISRNKTLRRCTRFWPTRRGAVDSIDPPRPPSTAFSLRHSQAVRGSSATAAAATSNTVYAPTSRLCGTPYQTVLYCTACSLFVYRPQLVRPHDPAAATKRPKLRWRDSTAEPAKAACIYGRAK